MKSTNLLHLVVYCLFRQSIASSGSEIAVEFRTTDIGTESFVSLQESVRAHLFDIILNADTQAFMGNGKKCYSISCYIT
jgi:hypothetical protein